MSKSIPRTAEEYRAWWEENAPSGVVYGQCWCTCGEAAPLSPVNDRTNGYFKGEPRRYIYNHWSRAYRNAYYIVEDRGFSSPCWIWQGSNTGGKQYCYGMMRIGDSTYLVHRVYYERRYGPLLDTQELHHMCEPTLCCNPEHMMAVTKTQHNRRSPAVRLTYEDAERIRELYATGRYRQKDIGAMFGIYQADVSRIVLRKYWS